jgi:hypothetical protein
VKATGVLDLRGSYENENDSKTDPTFLLFFWLGRRSALHQTSTERHHGSSGLLAAFFALLSYPKDHLIPFF